MDPLFSSSRFGAGMRHLCQTRTMSNELLEKLNRRHENYETFLCIFEVTSCSSNPSVSYFNFFVHYFILFPLFFFFSSFFSYSCFYLFLLNSFSSLCLAFLLLPPHTFILLPVLTLVIPYFSFSFTAMFHS